MQDIPSLLRSMHARMYMTPYELQILDAAASDIERLRGLATITIEKDPPPPVILPANRFDDVDRRIAELESRVRLTQHRLAAAAQMCADIDRDPRIHSSIQVAMSLVGKALESEPQEDDDHA